MLRIGHSLYQVWTLWDLSFLSFAPEKQTDGQTENASCRLLTPIDRVGVGNQFIMFNKDFLICNLILEDETSLIELESAVLLKQSVSS